MVVVRFLLQEVLLVRKVLQDQLDLQGHKVSKDPLDRQVHKGHKGHKVIGGILAPQL